MSSERVVRISMQSGSTKFSTLSSRNPFKFNHQEGQMSTPQS